jgi:hypothetical protein
MGILKMKGEEEKWYIKKNIWYNYISKVGIINSTTWIENKIGTSVNSNSKFKDEFGE